MAETKIEWADQTWTPIVGCDAVSPACAFCYAALMAARLEAMGMEKYAGLATRHGNVGKWTGKVTVWEPEIERPLSVKKPASWFLTSMGDVFHPSVPFEVLDRLFAVMALADHHTFYVLTKRPEIAAKYLSDASDPEMRDVSRDCLVEGQAQSIHNRLTGEDPSMWLAVHWPLNNVVIGCTAEDQERADERRPHMAAIAAAGWRTMVSYEPALELVNWNGWEFLSWLISGGESGQHARISHPDCHRGARDWCAANSIPYLFKQWGEHIPCYDAEDDRGQPTWDAADGGPEGRFEGVRAKVKWFGKDAGPNEDGMARVGKKRAGRLLDGVEHNGMPGVRP
jgi:protein gp37